MKYYFIGIGGIGMSALARYLHAEGHEVAGYDRSSSPLTESLEAEGMTIGYEDALSSIPSSFQNIGEDLQVVRTPAVPMETFIIQFFTKAGAAIMKRSQMLASLSSSKRCIAVAGTHGKTTTSSILAHLLRSSELGCTAFVGGIMTGYDTNVLIDPKSPFIVLEADEFDRSFHYLEPEIAIVTSTDADHLDIYGDGDSVKAAFVEFASRVRPEGRIIAHVDTGLEACPEAGRYGIERGGIRAENIRVEAGRFVFDADFSGIRVEGLSISLPGRHNVLNALAACSVALHLGVDAETVKAALASYAGVRRRFEFVERNEEVVFIDDYAHHPSEIQACVSSVKELFPGKRITAVFQPHLFSRTRDFMDGFAAALSEVNEVVLVDIYPAREEPIDGVSSQRLLEKISVTNKVLCEKGKLPAHIAARDLEVLLTMGAGDIDREIPRIQEALKIKYSKS